MARVTEFIFKIKVHERSLGSPTVRAWCKADNIASQAERDACHMAVCNAIRTISVRVSNQLYLAQVAEAVAKLPCCNAVEVTDDGTNSGVLIYPDWP